MKKSKQWIVERDDGTVQVMSYPDPVSKKKVINDIDRDFWRDDGDERGVLQIIPSKLG